MTCGGDSCRIWKLLRLVPGAFQEQHYHRWPGNLQLGMAVRVPDNKTPLTGMGSLKRGEVGDVRGYISSNNLYICDFLPEDTWVYPPSPTSIVILDAVPVTFQDGQQVRIMGLVHDSALNGRCGVIIKKSEQRMSIVYCVKFASWALSTTPHEMVDAV